MRILTWGKISRNTLVKKEFKKNTNHFKSTTMHSSFDRFTQKVRRLVKRKRADVACTPCKLAKMKCNSYRPCTRCKRKPDQRVCIQIGTTVLAPIDPIAPQQTILPPLKRVLESIGLLSLERQ